MLWFNAEKDCGALETADGERIEVSGAAFAAGEKPVGRCAGLPVEFELDSLGGDAVVGIGFIPDQDQRRARMRNRR